MMYLTTIITMLSVVFDYELIPTNQQLERLFDTQVVNRNRAAVFPVALLTPSSETRVRTLSGVEPGLVFIMNDFQDREANHHIRVRYHSAVSTTSILSTLSDREERVRRRMACTNQ